MIKRLIERLRSYSEVLGLVFGSLERTNNEKTKDEVSFSDSKTRNREKGGRREG